MDCGAYARKLMAGNVYTLALISFRLIQGSKDAFLYTQSRING
eukprot:XP_001705646.1 Hypothetical protein GL50803_10510 [Giardia lamblia ATCC 50803]